MRVYMPNSARWNGSMSFWQKMFNPSLAYHLIKKAKAAGIEQAIFQRTFAGYLKGGKLVFDQSEVSPQNLPLCVELIDTSKVLEDFFNQNKEHFVNCRVVLFKAAQLLI